jgi:hypothetical protein
MLGTNEVISVEMTEYYDGGGAHPDNSFWSLTYDLKGNKELKFADFVPAEQQLQFSDSQVRSR